MTCPRKVMPRIHITMLRAGMGRARQAGHEQPSADEPFGVAASLLARFI